ncbi:MAG: hypothetical protein HY275_18800 [Gemmatimonadetes bacterium]|nr:hypothetical protein [Gemmatimonadota bacterium]
MLPAHPRALRCLLALLLLVASSAAAQGPTDPLPSCDEDLQALRDRIAANYGGFRLEVTGPRRERFERDFADLRERASRTTGPDCRVVLKALVDWFEDPHLFLYETRRLDTAETTRRAATVASLPLDEAGARAALAQRAGELDPIEGIWYDGPLRYAVVRDPAGERGRFVAVLLTADSTLWRPGHVRAHLVRRAEGRYDVELYERNFALQHRVATLHKRVLLRLSPGIWGKAFPVVPADSGVLDPVDAHRPTITRRPGTVIVAIPSHDGPYKAVLDRLVRANEDALKHADRLIIDLRGNEGGGAGMSDALLPYVVSERMRPSLLEPADAVMLSSDDQIAYARRAFGPETSRFVQGLVARLQAAPGEFVAFAAPGEAPQPSLPAPILGPRRVGVITDRGTVSAAEVLVLTALRSERVTVFGEPTAGALDYQSVSIVPFSARERRWFLGYPTITRSTRLPAGGMRGHGIAPTVPLDLSRLDDPITVVEEALRGPAPE